MASSGLCDEKGDRTFPVRKSKVAWPWQRSCPLFVAKVWPGLSFAAPDRGQYVLFPAGDGCPMRRTLGFALMALGMVLLTASPVFAQQAPGQGAAAFYGPHIGAGLGAGLTIIGAG